MGDKFKVGDLVKLRSGSVVMTVIETTTQNPHSVINYLKRRGSKNTSDSAQETKVVSCSWFENGKQRLEEFDEILLMLAFNSLK